MEALFLMACLVGVLIVMGNAVSVVWAMTITTTESLSDAGLASGQNAILHNAYNEGSTLTAATTPPVTKIAEFLLTLTDGAATIDLRSLTGTNGAIIDGNGLKVQLLRIKNLGANNMTFEEGASNGYALGSSIVVLPGGIAQIYFNDASPDIGSSDKTIDVAGTGAQTAEITIIMG